MQEMVKQSNVAIILFIQYLWKEKTEATSNSMEF